MRHTLGRFVIPILLVLGMAPGWLAVQARENRLAYIGPDGNVYILNPEQPTPTPVTTDADAQSPLDMVVFVGWGEIHQRTPPAHLYCCIHWSPDGTQFTFVDMITKQLFLAAPGERPRLLAPDVTFFYPASAWSPDGKQIAYLAAEEWSPDLGRELLVIPATGGAAHRAVIVHADCERDGPGPEIAGYIVDAELGRELFFKPLSLDWTPWGVLYGVTDNCQGAGLVSPDGKPIWQNDRLLSPSVSPDQTRAVAYENADGESHVVLVDVASGTTTRVPTLDGTSIKGWSADGQSIVYATYAQVSQTIQAAQADDPLQNYPAMEQATTYAVTLWRMPLDGSSAVQLFTTQGYEIGLLSTQKDGGTLAFSLVTSGEAMLKAKNAGSPEGEWKKLMPHPEVVVLPLNGEAPVWIGRGGQPAFGP